jgi:hypothetical protein
MAIKETVQIDVESNATDQTNELVGAINDLKDAIKEMSSGLEKGLGDVNKELGDTKKSVEAVGDTAGKSEKGVSKLSKAFGNVGKASGIIFLVQKAMEILYDLFNNNQRVVDVFNTAFNFLQIAFSDFVKFIEANIGGITGFFKGIFEDPKAAMISFKDAFVANIVERFESFLDTLGFLASAVKKVFSGDFSGALDDVKNAGTEMVDVFTGVDGTVGKVVEGTKKVAGAVANYTKKTYEAATAMTDLNKQAELADVINQGLIEKYDLQAEQQRQIRDDERNTIEERIAANNRLGEILDEQEAAMRANAQIRLAQAEQNANLDKNNIEFQKELIDARNEVAAVDAQIAGFRSEQLSNQEALERELLEIARAKKEAEIDANEIAKQAAIDQEENTIRRLELEKELAEETKNSRVSIIEDELALTKEGTARYQELLDEKLLLEAEYAAESKRIDYDTEVTKREQRQETMAAAYEMTKQGLEAVSALTEAFAGQSEEQQRKAFQVQKALSAASTVMSTIEGAQSAYTTAQKSPITAVFPAYPVIQAGLATAFGIAKLKQIQSQQFQPGGTTSTPSRSSGGGGGAPSVPATQRSPQFNVVGSSGINQIAESLSQDRPVKAYVVGGEVTSQQQLDRKRVKTASI